MGRKIVLGVTGSIAAYKAAELVRLFVDQFVAGSYLFKQSDMAAAVRALHVSML